MVAIRPIPNAPQRDTSPSFPRYYGTDLGMMPRSLNSWQDRNGDDRGEHITYPREPQRTNYRPSRRNGRR